MNMLLTFIYDSSNERVRFFTAFRMTNQGVFCHSERAFGRGRISIQIARVWINENIIGYHFVIISDPESTIRILFSNKASARQNGRNKALIPPDCQGFSLPALWF